MTKPSDLEVVRRELAKIDRAGRAGGGAWQSWKRIEAAVEAALTPNKSPAP